MSRTNRHYTGEFRLQVVKYVLEEMHSKLEASRHFGVGDTQVGNWVKSFSEKGVSALFEDRRGKNMPGQKRKGRKPNGRPMCEHETPEQEVVRLRKELEYAKMENEFLKKLDALVRERIEREEGK